MRNLLTSIGSGVDHSLRAKLHVFRLVIAGKGDIIGGNVQGHSISNVSLHAGSVTDTALNV